MNWQAYCGVCFLKQVISIGNLLHLSDNEIKLLMREVASLFSRIPDDMSPPEFAIEVYDLLKKRIGKEDLFADVKKKSNRQAKVFLDAIEEKGLSWKNEHEKLLFYLKLAIAGNIIDYGVARQDDPLKGIDSLFDTHFPDNERVFDLNSFIGLLEGSSSVLYLLDNCGEVIFDMAFVRQIRRIYPRKQIIFVVRGGPVINDVTVEDAIELGLYELGDVISTGIAAPGVILKRSDRKVLEAFDRADLIISKGQGNFESLWGTSRSYPLFFLFVAKCGPVAKLVGAKEGQLLLLNSTSCNLSTV